MSSLRQGATAYLALRRALGFKLITEERVLLEFIAYCEANAVEHLTTSIALAWATSPPRGGTNRVYHARRLIIARAFAQHLHSIDPAHEVPPADLLDGRYQRIIPHVFRDTEIIALMRACSALRPTLRAASWRTFIGLLAVTGLRVSEACALNRDDVERDSGAVRILNTKFNKSRLVFLHATTLQALAAYEQLRDRACPHASTRALLINDCATRLSKSGAPHTFARLLKAAGIHPRPGQRRPRLHDARHTFAAATLLDWHADRGDVQARLPLLSTWLGHVNPHSTYWYLQAIPELLALTAARLERDPPERSA